jgi:hypothetical protein
MWGGEYLTPDIVEVRSIKMEGLPEFIQTHYRKAKESLDSSRKED